MKQLTKKLMGAFLCVALWIGAAGCGLRMPTEVDVYKTACQAMIDAELLTENSEHPPIEKCRLYLGKNAARVDIPYRNSSYTVYLKRVARTWVVENHEPTPGVAL